MDIQYQEQQGESKALVQGVEIGADLRARLTPLITSDMDSAGCEALSQYVEGWTDEDVVAREILFEILAASSCEFRAALAEIFLSWPQPSASASATRRRALSIRSRV